MVEEETGERPQQAEVSEKMKNPFYQLKTLYGNCLQEVLLPNPYYNPNMEESNYNIRKSNVRALVSAAPIKYDGQVGYVVFRQHHLGSHTEAEEHDFTAILITPGEGQMQYTANEFPERALHVDDEDIIASEGLVYPSGGLFLGKVLPLEITERYKGIDEDGTAGVRTMNMQRIPLERNEKAQELARGLNVLDRKMIQLRLSDQTGANNLISAAKQRYTTSNV